MNDDNDDIEQSSAPLIEHLTELRNRLIRSVVAFAFCMICAFTVASPIFNFLANPIVNILKINGQAPDLIFTGLQQGFMVNIRISLSGGVTIAANTKIPTTAYFLDFANASEETNPAFPINVRRTGN